MNGRIRIPTLLLTLAATLATTAAASAQIRRSPRLSEAELRALVPDRAELLEVRVPAEIVELVERLGSESFDEREAAMEQLVEIRVDRSYLYALLYRDALDSEQRFRLLQVLRHRLIHEPRGAVGISMRQRQVAIGEPIEIIVSDLVPGLPAERVLQVQDRIFMIDGNPLMTQDDLVRRVQAKLPGDSVRLSIRRAVRDAAGGLVLDDDNRPTYEELELELPLGSVDDLRRRGNNDVFQSSLTTRRQAEVSIASERFSPVPSVIQIDAGFAGVVAFNDVDLDPDDHYLIQRLLANLRSIEAGHMAMNSRLRMQWHQQLQVIREQAMSPGVPAAERAYLARVADRYQELIAGR